MTMQEALAGAGLDRVGRYVVRYFVGRGRSFGVRYFGRDAEPVDTLDGAQVFGTLGLAELAVRAVASTCGGAKAEILIEGARGGTAVA
jgi:hypothetical protein